MGELGKMPFETGDKLSVPDYSLCLIPPPAVKMNFLNYANFYYFYVNTYFLFRLFEFLLSVLNLLLFFDTDDLCVLFNYILFLLNFDIKRDVLPLL